MHSPPPTRVLIAGVSTRAAAESAARVGFSVTAIDAFADLDQHASVRAISLGQDFSAEGAARAALNIECDAVAYLSSFENHPAAVSRLAAGRALWGNAPAVLRRVRDPMLVTQALRRRGCATPDVFVAPDADDASGSSSTSTLSSSSGRWLLKPLASGGGYRVRLWRPATDLPKGFYLQELVDGTSGSVVFVAAGGRAVPFGVSRQLVGDDAFGAAGYRYCGNILEPAGDAALVDRACTLARAAAEEFGLVGVNGIDFVARAGVPHAIEVNPRWSSSMELVERAYGFPVFEAHAAACAAGELAEFDLGAAQRRAGAVGKAVVFARKDVAAGDTREWLPGGAVPSVRDVPHQGERIRAGQAVCTVFADGREPMECYAALVRRADRVYAELAAWEAARAGEPGGSGRAGRSERS